MEAADFADELERGGADFVRGYGWVEVEKHFDVPAHGRTYERIELEDDSSKDL